MLNLKLYNTEDLFIFKYEKPTKKNRFLRKSMNINPKKHFVPKRDASHGKNINEEENSMNFSEIETMKDETPEKLIQKLKDIQTQEIEQKSNNRKRNYLSKEIVEFGSYVEIKNKELLFMKDQVKIFKFKLKKVLFDNFGFKVMIYKKDQESGKNQLIMEVTGNFENVNSLIQMIKRVNKAKARYHPLASKFDSVVSESPFTNKNLEILNLRGFLNLFLIYSVMNFSRFFLEHHLNTKQFFFDQLKILFPQFSFFEYFVILFNYFLAILITYGIQYYSFKHKTSPLIINLVVVLYLIFFFALSSWLVYIFNFSIFINTFINGSNVSVLLKLISFSHVCHSIRCTLEEMNKNIQNVLTYEEMFQENQISKNNFLLLLHHRQTPTKLISPHHFLYYLAIPTFNFQLRYAKKEKIDVPTCIKRLIELPLWVMLFFCSVAYFVVPMLQESDKIFLEESNIQEKISFFIRLAMSCTFSWIIMFMAVFQGWCQAVSEVLRLADRRFYLDWWNSRKISEYWRLWNLPIHSFFLIHVSNPLTSLGINRHVINTVVFVISAIFHEYVISLAVKKLCVWTLITFSLQYFYILFETAFMKFFKLEKSMIGNYGFWAMLCFYGQPTLLLQYYFYLKYGQNFLLWPF